MTPLERQVAFLVEADRLKSVDRSNVLTDASRPENAAEHSWHVALFAMVFADRCPAAAFDEAMRMILLHDLPEIDSGDHPIHLPVDTNAVAEAEAQGAARLFGLLPDTIGAELRVFWQSYATLQSEEAQFAKDMDHAQPVLQALWTGAARPDHLDIARQNLIAGRAARFAHTWPDLHAYATAVLDGAAPPDDPDLAARLSFLREADRLKSVTRATTLADATRHENSAEHSWHLGLYALVLADHAGPDVNLMHAIQMLILHDIVEIDAGDVPIFLQTDPQAKHDAETAAADRLYGLLPHPLAAHFRALWDEYEAAETPSAQFARALDRFQPPMQNLASKGAGWASYDVTPDKIEARVAPAIKRAAPALWDYAKPRIDAFFRSSY